MYKKRTMVHSEYRICHEYRILYHMIQLWSTIKPEVDSLRTLRNSWTFPQPSFPATHFGWLGGVMVRTLDLWLAVAGSNPGHDTAWDRWLYFAGELSWDITTTQVNSALHPSGVTKSSTSFGWGKGGKVTSAGWQVTLCDLIWHVISRSSVAISITNCYIRLTYLLTYSRDTNYEQYLPCPRSTFAHATLIGMFLTN